jgi:hypothetical protein
LLDFTIRFAGHVDDGSYYFIALDADGDFGADGPVPVAAGPYWENGWGTGSFTHYVEYHQGRYELYRPRRQLILRHAGGGIVDASGAPLASDTGLHTIRVTQISLGATSVSGAGMVTGVNNLSDQNGSFFDLETDATGKIVSIAFRRNQLAGRSLTPAEQATLNALTGTALTADSLAPFGLHLVLGAPAAATQTLRIEPANGLAEDKFRATGSGAVTTTVISLQANATLAGIFSPLPGGIIVTRELVVNDEAILAAQMSTDVALLGPVYASTPPAGGNELQFTLEIAALAATAPRDLSVNFITTTDLLFDPLITNPDQHCYDGLGVTGDEYATFRLDQDRTIQNSDQLEPEGSGDFTLAGSVTPDQKAAVDIIDWTVRVRNVG